jgi:hypothetical protein
VNRVGSDSVARDRRLEPLLDIDYPTHPDGSPNTEVPARIVGTMETKLNALTGTLAGNTYWQVILNSYYEGNRATHTGPYRITKGGSEVWSGTVSGAHGGFLGLFLPGEKHFANEHNGRFAQTCDLSVMGTSSHYAWYAAPGLGGFPSVEWGHATDNAHDTDDQPACPESPPIQRDTTPEPPVGTGISFCDGPLKWYLCWAIDWYDQYGNYMYREWLYCMPLCD